MIFVLIHGGQHGGWCWDLVAPRLESAGHTVIAPDLPGMGADRTPLKDVTLEMTADRVADLVRRQPEKVVLVGHSMGGLTISEVAERVPERMHGLVYVTAILAPGGMSMAETCGNDMEEMMIGVIVSPDGVSTTFDPALAPAIFFNTCEPELATCAAQRLSPQPMQPITMPLKLSAERYGSVRRAYVETLQDKMLPISLQRQMQDTLPCDMVKTMDCDHSPFLSDPDTLDRHLQTIGRFLRS